MSRTPARGHESEILHLAQDDGRARVDDARQVHQVGARGAHLRQERLLVRLLVVDALVRRHLQADLLGRGLEDVGDALAVELLVVQDVDLLGAQLLGPLGAHGALDVIRRRDPEVVDEAHGAVDLGLPGGGAVLPGETGIRVGRRDLGHMGPVVDRDRHLRRAGVVGADVDDRERVGDGLVRVLRLDRPVPLAGLGRGVVEVHDLEAVPRDHAVHLGDGHVHAVLHAGALGEHGPLHGPRRVDPELALRTLLRVGGCRERHDERRRGGHSHPLPPSHIRPPPT